MISTLEGRHFSVLVTNQEVNEFARNFPCHGLDLDAEYLFQFDVRNGDLVDITVLRDGEIPESPREDEDTEGLRVLSEDATLVGAEELGLRDVIGLRFGHEALAM
jgi:hypothetical protein